MKRLNIEFQEDMQAYIRQLASDINLYSQVTEDENGPENSHDPEGVLQEALGVLDHFFEQTYNIRLDNHFGTQKPEYLETVEVIGEKWA